MSQECNSPFCSFCKVLIKTAKQISINTTEKKRVPQVRKFLKFKVIGPECVKILLDKVTKFYRCFYVHAPPPPPPPPLPSKKVFCTSAGLLFNKSLLNLATWLIWRHSSSRLYRFSLTGQQSKVKTNFWIILEAESCLLSTFCIMPTIAVIMREPGLAAKQNLFIALLAWNVKCVCVCLSILQGFCLVCPA